MIEARLLRAPLAGALLALTVLATGCVDKAAEHRVRANAFLRGGDATAALKECDDGLAAKTDNLPLLILRGKALFELDRLDDSAAAYKRAIDAGKAEEPRALADAHLGLAMVASRQKSWADARREFETLVAINEKDATSHLNVARACLELKDFDCAVAHAETAGKLRGDEEPVLYTLGTVYLAVGKPKEAELTFQHICDLIPTAATCPYGLSLTYAKLGDKDRALKQLSLAVDRKIPNPERLAEEPGFAWLRGEPEFQAILVRAKKP